MTEMNDDPITLAQLLTARVCHDLSGAVGGVGTGAELLQDAGADGAPDAVHLLADSAAAATTRLRLYRAAFGREGSGAVPGPDEVPGLLSTYLRQGSTGAATRLIWPEEGADVLGRDAVRLLLNMVILARETLPRGGTVEVAPPQPEQGLAVEARGDGAALEPGVRAVLEAPDTPAEDLTPRTVHGRFIQAVAGRLGTSVMVEEQEGAVGIASGPVAA